MRNIARILILIFQFLFVMPLLSLFGCSTGSLTPLESDRKGVFDKKASGASGRRDPEKRWAILKGDPAVLEYEEKTDSVFRELKGYRWPLKQIQISSPFGKRGEEFHEGVDLRAKQGTPVYAAQSGVVIYSNSTIGGYGRMVVVRHFANLATIYAHNSKLLVKLGKRVRRGQLIAYSGNTGHTTGPHVHFEVRHGVTAMNPTALMSRFQGDLSDGIVTTAAKDSSGADGGSSNLKMTSHSVGEGRSDQGRSVKQRRSQAKRKRHSTRSVSSRERVS